MNNTIFKPWPKIPRWENENFTITEKLDGTNACVIISDDGDSQVTAQSRTRLITPDNDNFGFAQWVQNNKDELLKLGPGHHFGEWWGHGIQRGYGLTEKRFSLFNTARWGDANIRPACCQVVPVLRTGQCVGGEGELGSIINATIHWLKAVGSQAAPGYMNPEGFCIYLQKSNTMYKVPFNK